MPNRLVIAALVAAVGACSFSSAGDQGIEEIPPVISFEFVSSGGDEGLDETGTTLNIPVILDKPSEQRITVKCTALPGSGNAEEVQDFTIATLEVVFEPGITRVEVQVDIVHDLDDTESEEMFSLGLSEPVGAKLDPEGIIHTVVIADHILPRIELAQAATSTTENAPTMLSLLLTTPAEGPSTVVIGVAGGTAPAADSDDVAIIDGTVVSIPSGATSVLVPIGEIDDPRDENPVENLAFELRGASNNLVIGTLRQGTHAIGDNDDPPIATFSATVANTLEGAATVQVTITLSAESELPVTVGYARQGAADTADDNDATVSGNTVSFTPHTEGQAGQTSRSFTITIDDDDRDELQETVIVDLTSANTTNATVQPNTRFTLRIDEDPNDTPSVRFDKSTSSFTESDQTRNVEVTLSNRSDKTVTVNFTVGGTANGTGGGADYTLANGTVTFDPNQDSRNIGVVIIDNDPPTNEPDETVVITLTPGSATNATIGTPSVHTLTITE